MGAYVNPRPGITKEQWLAEHGKTISRKQAEKHADFEHEFLVVLVQNSFFKAAGIAYCPEEKTAFLSESDHRSREYYRVKKCDLISNSNLAEYLRYLKDDKKPD